MTGDNRDVDRKQAPSLKAALLVPASLALAAGEFAVALWMFAHLGGEWGGFVITIYVGSMIACLWLAYSLRRHLIIAAFVCAIPLLIAASIAAFFIAAM